MKHLATGMVAAAGLLASVVPSLAQYYYPPPPPRPYYRPGPPPGYYGGGYARPYRPVYGNICITSRGSCQTQPRPANSSCGCNIPGFGPKRGAIAAPQRW